jgi:hypothetical protein
MKKTDSAPAPRLLNPTIRQVRALANVDFDVKLTRLAGSAADPDDYVHRLIERLCPVTLPYEPDTAATFAVAGFNGRGLADDVMDVLLSLATNTSLTDEVAPDRSRMRNEFPYFGEAFARTEPA